MQTPPPLPIFSDPPTQRKPWLAILSVSVIILLIFAAVGALAIIRATTAPARVAGQFYQHLSAGRITEAQGLTSSQFNQVAGKDSLEKLAQSINSNLPGAEYRISRRELVKGTAIGTKTKITALVFYNGRERQIFTELVNENGNWKVFSFKISE